MFIQPSELAGSDQQTHNGVRVIDTVEKAHCLKAYLDTYDGVVGIDTETVGIDPRVESPVGRGRVVCWSLAFRNATGVHRFFLWWGVSGPLHSWLASDKPKCGHRIWGFDRHVINNMGVELHGIVGDTMYMAKLYRTDKRFKVGLKHLMKMLFGYELGGFAELFSRPRAGKETRRESIGKGRRKIQGVYVPTTLGLWYQNISFVAKRDLIPLEDIPTMYPDRLMSLYDYASLDAKATLELYEWALSRIHTPGGTKD